MTHSVDKQVGTLATVKAETHLVQVGLQMLGANLVPTPHNPALQQRESRFNAIGVNVGSEADVLFGAVVYGFVFDIADGLGISRPFICHKYVNISADVFLDVLLQSAALGVGGMEEAQIAAALTDTYNNFLVALAPLPVTPLLLSAYIGFVHLDSTVQQGRLNLFHGATYTMAEVPSGFVGTFVLAPDSPLELHRAHALLGFTQQQGCKEPDRQRQVRVVEDRAARGRELVLTTNTLEAGIFFQPRYTGIFAAWAHNTLRPAQTLKQLTAAVIGRIHLINFRESHASTS